MKPLIVSFFLTLLAYSLFFDKEDSNDGYKFGLDSSIHYEQNRNNQLPKDTLNMYAVTPAKTLEDKKVI